MNSDQSNDVDKSSLSDKSISLSRVGEFVTAALRYWEPRRIFYNLVLIVVVLVHFILSLPSSKSLIAWNNILEVFVLAILANVFYCAAYLVDIFVQLSCFRDDWLRWRWLLLTIGTTFAAVLAHFYSSGMLSHLCE